MSFFYDCQSRLLLATIASLLTVSSLAAAPPEDSRVGAEASNQPTPLAQAAQRVARGLAEGTVTVHSYKQSLAWEALLRLGHASDQPRLVQQARRSAAESGLTPGSKANYRRDPFNCVVFWLYRIDGDERWLDGFIEQTREYRANVHRSPEGAIEHPRGSKRGGGHAMLIDALQDYSSRMAMLGCVAEDPSCYREAVDQHRIYREIVRDPQTGLWCQGRGWRADPGELSPGAWSRGHGWLIRGMVDTLLLIPRDSAEAKQLQGYLRELADALLQVQQPDGMWHCLLHRPPADSPPEVSGTALIAGNLAIAVAEGFLDERKYAKAARRAFDALPKYVDEKGIVHSVSPGPGPLSQQEPWVVEKFPVGDQHGPFAMLFAALGEARLD